MKVRVSCGDRYEAQKLASLIFVAGKRETTYITQIVNVIGDEIVISAKDRSAHSILFKDSSHVDRFADFIQSVLEREHRIVAAATFAGDVEITKE